MIDEFKVFQSGLGAAMLFRSLITNWHEVKPSLEWKVILELFEPSSSDLVHKSKYLALINCFQWHLEDECRASYDRLEVIAQLKRSIDESNQRRVNMIDQIDLEILQQLRLLRSGPLDAPVALSTPGNVLDRLSILELKRYHVLIEGHQKNNANIYADSPAGVTQILEEQIKDLCLGLNTLISDLVSGNLRLKVYRTIKIYRTQ